MAQELKSCCLQINSDKVTERKRGSEQMKHLLDNASVVAYLDARPADGFNWDQVFIYATTFFHKGARRLEDEERKKLDPSQAVLTNRANTKRHLVTVPKLILRKASLRIPHISAKHVIDFVLNVLNRRNPYLLENFAGDFIQIAIKYLFHFPDYYLYLSADDWKSLFKILLWIYEHDLQNTSKPTVIDALERIVNCCKVKGIQDRVFLPSLILKKLPEFLCNTLKHHFRVPHYAIQSSLLQLLLTFTKTMACEWRYVVCKIGEETLDSVLALWENVSSARQSNLLEYLNLLIMIHHPQQEGNFHQNGNYVYDAAIWQRGLNRLYQLIFDHLQQYGAKKKFASVSGSLEEHYTIPQCLVDLASRLCHKLYQDVSGYGYLDVTQNLTLSTSTQSVKPNKRRKIEIGLQPLIGMLREEGTMSHCIPWYQILIELLISYRYFFDQEKCQQLLDLLTNVLAKCNLVTVQQYVLNCLEVLAQRYSTVHPESPSNYDLRIVKWTPVWEMTLRLVSGKQCSQNGLKLLQVLIGTRLIAPNASVFNLFYQGHVIMNKAALNTLLELLSKVSLPKSYKRENAVLLGDQVRESRDSILEAVLPLHTEATLTSLEAPSILGQILLLLRYRDSRLIQGDQDLLAVCKATDASDNSTINQIKLMEEFFIFSTFSSEIPKINKCSNKELTKVHLGDLKILDEEEKKVIGRVCSVLDQVLETEDGDNITEEKIQLYLNSLELLIILCLHIDNQRLDELVGRTIDLTSKAVQNIYRDAEGQKWLTLSQVFKRLYLIFQQANLLSKHCQENKINIAGKQLKELLTASTPASLINVVEKMIETRKDQILNSKASGSTQHESFRRDSTLRASSPDFDDDFDSSSTVDASCFMEIDEVDNHDDSDTNLSQGNVKLDDVNMFSPQDQCLVMAFYWMTQAFKSSVGENELDPPLVKVIGLILDLSECSSLPFSDLALVLHLCRTLFLSQYDEDNIAEGLQAISQIAKRYCQEPRIAAFIISILKDLLQANGALLTDNNQRSILQLSKGVLQRQLMGNHSQCVDEAIFQLNIELVKLDPKREWSKYSLAERDRCGELFDLIASPSYELRILSARSIHLLFVQMDGSLLEDDHQDRMFQNVYQTALEILTVQDAVPEYFKSDEERNKVTTLLLMIGISAVSSPYLETKSLFALCLAISQNNINSEFVTKVIGRIAGAVNTPIKTYMRRNLPYLATQWILHKNDIESFPFFLLECTSVSDFFEHNMDLLLPVLFEYEKLEVIENIICDENHNVRELLIERYPVLMAHIFPYIAVENHDYQIEHWKIQNAKKRYRYLERMLGKQDNTIMITKHIGHIILTILKSVHEPPREEEQQEGLTVVTPNPPHFPLDVVEHTLKFIGLIYEDSTLAGILKEKAKELHKVILGTLQYLAEASTPHDARHALLVVSALVNSLLIKSNGELEGAALYTVHMMIHTLTYYIPKLCSLSPCLADFNNEVLHRVCVYSLENYPEVIVSIIPCLVERLLPFVKKNSKILKSTLPIIELVFKSSHHNIQNMISRLPLLPDDEDFSHLRPLCRYQEDLVREHLGELSLFDKVKNFLSQTSDYANSHVLKFLCNNIVKNRCDIKEIFERLNENDEVLGHELIYRLVCLASGTDEQVSVEASKCLGELGPMSLSSSVFSMKDTSSHRIQISETNDIKIYTQLLTILTRYLTSENFDVVECSSSALSKILATEEGFAAARDLSEDGLKSIYPFRSSSKVKSCTKGSDADGDVYEQIVKNEEIWFNHSKFGDWISDLTCLLIEAGCGNDIITSLLPLCKIKPEFCTFLLPAIIHMALKTDKINRREVLSRQFLLFFGKHVKDIDMSKSLESNAPSSICMDKKAIQMLLKVIDYLRAQTPPRSSRSNYTAWERNIWLKINYLEVAQAAYYCGAYFSSLLYLEIHCEMLLLDDRVHEGYMKAENRHMSRLQHISSHRDSSMVHSLLLKVYSRLGDGDGVEGCGGGGGSKLLDPYSYAMRYKHRGQWMKVLEVDDASDSASGVVNTLKDLKFFKTLSTMLKASSLKPNHELLENQWESAWRLSQWDLEDESHTSDSTNICRSENSTFNQSFYFALQSLHHQDETLSLKHVNQARIQVINHLKLNQLESSCSVYSVLSQLQILSEVETAVRCIKVGSSKEEILANLNDLENVWSLRDTTSDVGYAYMEPIITARTSTLHALSSSCESKKTYELIHLTLLKKSLLTRNSPTFSLSKTGCEGALFSAANLNHLSQSSQWRTQLEAAEVSKYQGDIQHAMAILGSLLQDMQQSRSNHVLYSKALNLYGCVLLDSRAKAPQLVLKEYLFKSVELLKERTDSESQRVFQDSYHKLAVYGDKLYKEVRQYLESDTVESKKHTIDRSEAEFKKIQALISSCSSDIEKKELSKRATVLKKNIAIDQNFINDLEKERKDYMFLALKYYLRCLSISHDQDLHIYRAVALWMDNADSIDINREVDKFSPKIKSSKFIPLLYQLVARLSNEKDNKGFCVTLLNVLVRMCLDHPHHSLPAVIALAHAHADEKFKDSSGGGRKRSQRPQVIEEDRVLAAKELIQRLRKERIGKHVVELEKVSLAYLSLANWTDLKEKKLEAGDKVSIPSNQPLVNLRNLEFTSALTRPLSVKPSGNYDPPLISCFERTCTFVGGINAPKRLTLRTSDGMSQFELLKGNDDIRQDAVLEQVFRIVNTLLANNPDTKERNLSIRTYQVVPLSQKSGLIQWCDNTQPFGEYLIGKDKKSGAHKHYRPNDYTAQKCRFLLGKAKPESLEYKYNVYMDILKNFHPVFRHFFWENYPSPQEWYKRRSAYTRSVATNSMVGYIFGLGDRHVENILLDKSTAELIHIDLGIAFEFGKMLPTPETVPFRLTQDVVDGLGVMGIEGPLRKSCEATLAVLRKSADVLVTIVEVLRHDPLYQWTLSPQQVARLQEDAENVSQAVDISSASMADRVVLRVQQKLSGCENGLSMTIQEQVSDLLQQATNLSNLSRLFPGWQPYV